MTNFHLVSHPLITDALAHLRNKNTPIEKFRFYSDRLCMHVFSGSIEGLEFREEKIETPVNPTTVQKLSDNLVVIPVLRSGVAMLLGALQCLPKIKVGMVGMQRDEETAIASKYYWKLPKTDEHSVLMIIDPMLATGGSILNVLREMKDIPAKHVRVVCVVAAPEGIEAVHKEFPNVPIYAAALDERLNEKKYIIPGLGDYGDRYFGT